MAKRTENKRIYPTEDDPKYGESFFITGIQLLDPEGRFSKLIDMTISSENNKFEHKMLMKVANNWINWKKQKRGLSDSIIQILDDAGCEIKYREVVAFRIKYLGIDGEFIV